MFSNSSYREMYSNDTMRYRYAPSRMTKIKNSDNTKYWQGCGEIGSVIIVDEDVKCHSHLQHKLNLNLPYNPAVPLLGRHLSQRNENLRSHTNLYTNIHTNFICNNPKLETPQMSFNGELLNYSTFMPWKRKRTMTE
jgi:hypothetical protein